MLQLVLGRSGFGKTHHILDCIAAFVRAHEGDTTPCYWIVPEQASFETERALVRALGDKTAARVRVLSFTRMCETLMKSHTLRPLSNGAKIMLMSRAVGELSDRLSLLGGSKRADAMTSLLDIVAECRQSAVTCADLSEAAQRLPEGTLRQKTEELALLLETYDALAAQSGSDPQESLVRLAAFLREHREWQGAQVFVDGFKGFTAPELQVLTALMGQVDKLTVTLCTDRVHDETQGMDRFSVVMETARRLIAAAQDAACTVASPTMLMMPHRFTDEALCTLEATAFTPEFFETDDSDAVQMTVCTDIYDESAYVARTIRRLLRQDGLRAREIAVVARDLTEYIGVLDVALEQAEVPFYLDRRTPIAAEGLVTAVLTAVRIAAGDWRTESLLRLMKTGLLGFSVSSGATLENYVYIWNITGSQFKTEWTAHPRGFQATMDARDEARLSHLNRLRRRLVRPLLTLSDALKEPLDGQVFAKAVYRYIRDAHIDRFTALQIRRLRRCGEPALAEHTQQVWNALIELLDDMASVLSVDNLTATAAVELLAAAAVSTDVGSVPQSLDAVQIGAADRIRFASPRVVFVLGANEGVFPALPSAGGVITDRERRQLCEVGVAFEDHREQHTANEHFLAYAALSAPSERVYISYLSALPDGGKGERSSLCQTVLAHLPFVKLQPSAADDGSDIESAEEAFERMAQGFRANTPLSQALYRLLYKDVRYRGRLEIMSRIAEDRPIAFESDAAAKEFFGKRMILSPSRVEQYHKCRFAYFCQYGLKALPRRRAVLDAMEFGTLTHYVMENTLPIYITEGIKTIRKARCYDDAKDMARRFVQEQMGGLEEKSERFLYLLSRLEGVCGNFLWQAVRELSQSHFTPVDYELDIALSSTDEHAVEPMMFHLPDGTQIAMIGKVDRVDLYDDGNRRFIRVIDYKTGSKVFALKDVVDGINLQMLIYMLTLWKNGTPRYGEVLPAGLLYMLSKTPMIKVDAKNIKKSFEQEQQKAMRMNGLLLDDEQVLQAMEPGLQGFFIPAELKKDGTLKATSAVATLAQFGKLGRRAQTLLTDMAKTLRDGDIDACPYKLDPCEYCDYRAVCGHEDDDRVREPSFGSSADALAALDDMEEENEWNLSS